MTDETKPPQHAFEVTIRIGGNDWDYVLRTMDELAYHLKDHGSECGISSGGWNGSHSVDIAKREISPDEYRAELAEWMDNARKVAD